MNRSARAQISTLAKDEGLIATVLRLCDNWGDHAFDVVDHWESYLHGVGLARRDDHSVLVYIENFGRPVGTYYVELEDAPTEDILPYTSSGRYDSVSFEDLSSLVGRHLGLAANAGN